MPKTDIEVVEAIQDLNSTSGHRHVDLGSDTNEETIRLRHKDLVAEALSILQARRERVSANTISEMVCLPVWNVRRALKSLRRTRKKSA